MENAGLRIAIGAALSLTFSFIGLVHLLTARAPTSRHIAAQPDSGVDSYDNAIRKQFLRDGDDGSKPRLVVHFATFKAKAGRDSFDVWLRSSDYMVDEESNGLSVDFAKITPISPPNFDATVKDLEHRATRFGGEYDGWQCESVTSHIARGIERRGSGDRIPEPH
jgi:hypothetical protein